ncbi:MAG: tetratricopeptide repeat protein [Phycisphaerae bacterium]|jgi:tetratricopeptide (TPR) repeat protein|nr:tetratricopeptide repeat protein [Phycisphaerae bacterium]
MPSSRTCRTCRLTPALLLSTVIGAIIGVSSAEPPVRQADLHYRAGLGLLERGEHAMALIELDAFVAGDPTGPEAISARYARAICLVELKRPKEAAEELDRVLAAKEFALRGDALLLRARIAFDAADYETAADRAGRIETEAPTFAHRAVAAQIAGEAALRAGKADVALATLDRLMATNPAPEVARRSSLLAAHACVHRKDDRGATERLGKAPRVGAGAEELATIDLLWAQCLHRLGDNANAFQRYDLAVKGVASDAALLGLGQTGRLTGRTDAALLALDTLLDRSTIPASVRIPASIEAARIALDAGNCQKAVTLLDGLKAPAADMNDELGLRLLSWRATAHAACQDQAGAAAILGNALEQYPRSPLAPAMRFDRAGHLLATKAWKAALEEYNRFLKAAGDQPLTAQARARRAICLARLGQAEEARAEFALALQALPPDAVAERELVLAESLELATAASDWTFVTRFASELLAMSKDPIRRREALLRQGIAAARQERPAETIEALTTLLNEAPDGPQAPHAAIERAEAFLTLGQVEEAIQDLRCVAESKQESVHRSAARARLANVLLRAGRADEAQALLVGAPADGADDLLVDLAVAQSIRGEHDKAVTTLDRFIEQAGASPRRAEALARRGIVHARLGSHAKAIADLNAALSGPHSAALAADLRSAASFERAMVLIAAGGADSIGEGRSALVTLAKETGPYRPFALIELARFDVDAATLAKPASITSARARLIACTESLSDARPADRGAIEERVLYLTGLLESRAGQHEAVIDALGHFRERLGERFGTSPLRVSTQLVLAESLLAVQRGREAAVELKSAIDGGLPDDSLEPSLLRLGEALGKAQDWTGSDSAFADHLRRFPRSPLTHQAAFGRAWASEQLGKHNEAIDRYRAIVSSHEGPTAARAQFQVGECLFAQSKHEDAVREFMKVDVLFAYPEWSAAALYEAGRCLVALQKVDQARKVFASVSERFGSTRWAELAARDAARLEPDALPGRDRGSGT